MKKVGLLIVMTLALCLCGCGSDSSTTKETGSGDTTAYTYGNVTFEIPTAWGEPTENNDSDEDEIYYFYPEGQKADSIAPAMLMISVTKGNFSDNMSKKEIETNFKQYNSGLTSEDITIKSNKIINSFKYPCEYITGKTTVSGETLQIAAYILFYKGDIYGVMMGTAASNKNDYSSDLTNIVNSLEYDEDKNDDSAIEQSTAEQPEEEEEEVVSQEFKNALEKAQSYSDIMYMSKKGIYEQLTSDAGEGFPADAAKYAIKHVDADWKYNALQKGKSYYNDMSMSKNEVYEQLVSDAGEGFTAKQAQYAVEHLDD